VRLTKYTHACIALDAGHGRLLIDPGIWTEPEAYEGVDEILITHEHADHIDVEKLGPLARTNSALVVRAPRAVVGMLVTLGDNAVAVAPDDRFTVAGMSVHVVGGLHAEIYDGLPGCANLGFVIDGTVYHPGDALFVPSEPIDSLLLPIAGPWLKLAEAIDFVHAIAPIRAFSIHDALLSEKGAAIVDRWIDQHGGTDYRRLPLGASVDL